MNQIKMLLGVGLFLFSSSSFAHDCNFGDPKITGKAHSNGGGFVADGALVANTVYVDADSSICPGSVLTDQVRVVGHSMVRNSKLHDRVVVAYGAAVFDGSEIFDDVQISGGAAVVGSLLKNNVVVSGGAALDYMTATDNAIIVGSSVVGNSPQSPTMKISGHAVISHASVVGIANVRDYAQILGTAVITGDGAGIEVYENARIMDQAWLKVAAKIHGDAVIRCKTIITNGADISTGDYCRDDRH